MDLLLEKLNALTATWKALPAHGTEPDMGYTPRTLQEMLEGVGELHAD